MRGESENENENENVLGLGLEYEDGSEGEGEGENGRNPAACVLGVMGAAKREDIGRAKALLERITAMLTKMCR